MIIETPSGKLNSRIRNGIVQLKFYIFLPAAVRQHHFFRYNNNNNKHENSNSTLHCIELSAMRYRKTADNNNSK